MRNIILTFTLVFITACTIGGEEASEGVVTIDSTTQVEVAEVEKTFEEGVLDFAQCMRAVSYTHLTLPTILLV